MTNVTSRRLSYHLSNKGQLNFPGITAASKQAAEELLLKDAEVHHCLFRSAGFHNHLSHHILAAYDLGAPAGLLTKIYKAEEKLQRPIFLKEKDKHIVVDNKNWTQYLGNQNAYSASVGFFSQEIADNGAVSTLEKYFFGEEANADGIHMLTRVVSGAVHPFIHIGYAVEFGIDTLLATGLAQACVHNPIKGTVFKIDKSPPEQSITLLELLRRIYDSPILKPIPYDPNMLLYDRIRIVLDNGGAEELQRLCALYHIPDNITDTELEKKIKECIFVATLIMSGTGRRGRKPRLDFYLMHLVTSSIFLHPLCAALRNAEHKAALLRAYVPVSMLYVLARGRPRIDPELIMSYSAHPRPPTAQKEHLKPSEEAIGSPWDDECYNPWPALIEGCLYHSESHVPKAMRTLMLGARKYGDTPAGQVPGSFTDEGKETHAGIGKVDGTLFVRAAGVMMETLGWSGHGQKEGVWDRSGLGWDAAWESGE